MWYFSKLSEILMPAREGDWFLHDEAENLRFQLRAKNPNNYGSATDSSGCCVGGVSKFL